MVTVPETVDPSAGELNQIPAQARPAPTIENISEIKQTSIDFLPDFHADIGLPKDAMPLRAARLCRAVRKEAPCMN
jgi:hypothetical protein